MSDLQTVNIAQALIKIRWEEPYVSEGVNRSIAIFPRGVYRGFTAKEASTPDKTFLLRIDPTAGGMHPDSSMVYWDRANGFGLVVRDPSEPEFDMSARFSAAGNTEIPGGGEIWWVWADVSYATSSQTSGDYHVTLDGVPISDDAVIFAKITMPGGATTILDSYISIAEMTLPYPTKREAGAYSANDQYHGLLTGEEAWNIPSLEHKRAMNAASPVPTASNPFVTRDYLNGSMDESLIPDTDNSYDLGSSSKQWRDIYINRIAYIDTLSLSDVNGEGVSTNLVPTLDNTVDLGKSARRWKDLYIDGSAYLNKLEVSESAGGGVASGLIPDFDQGYSLGTSSKRWATFDTMYAEVYNILTAARADIDEIGTNLVPTGPGLYLGTGIDYWGHGNVKNQSVLSLRGGTVPVDIDIDDLAAQKIFHSGSLSGGHVRPWDEKNTIDTYNLANDFCVAYPLGIDRPFIYAVSANATRQNSIIVITQLFSELSTTNIDITSFLETGDWRPDAICSDGVSIYIHATKMDVTDQYTHKVFALSLSVTTGYPDGVKTGWDSGGVGTLTGGGSAGNVDTGVFDQGRPYKIISTSGKLICVNPWIISTTTATLELITVINGNSGSIMGEHSGQTTPLAGYYYSGGLATDDTNIYFCTWKDGGPSYLNVGSSCKIFRTSIAGIQTGTPTNEELVYTAMSVVLEYCNSLIWDGGALWMVLEDNVWAWQSGEMAYPVTILSSATFKPRYICFDGKNLWVIGNQLVETSRWQIVLLKISAAKLYKAASNGIISEDGRYFLSGPSEMETSDIFSDNIGRLLFDGTDVWAIMNEIGTAPFASGTIRRLPKVSML